MPVPKRRLLFLTATAIVLILVISTTLGPVVYAGRQPGLTSFGLIHFAGYLFFLLMPVEALVPLYQAEGHAGTVLVPLAVATALVAQGVDYWIGRSIQVETVQRLLGAERFARFDRLVGRWGGAVIFVFNLFPLSSPNVLLVAGISRYHAGKALLISTLGLTVKYVTIVYVVHALR